MTKRDAIAAAFQQLSLWEGRELMLEAVVSMLSGIDKADAARMPFIDVGAAKTKKELEWLARADSDVAKELKTLHQPAILALAEQGYCRGIDATPDEIWAAAKRAIRTYRKWVPDSVRGGRPRNNLAHALGAILARYYEELTGKVPGRKIDSHSGFPRGAWSFYGPGQGGVFRA